jgi:anti-anti-sigma factor
MVREIPDPAEFHVTVLRADGLTNVAVAGEVDIATVGEFVDALREHLASGPVVLDMRELTFMDSSGVRALDALLGDVEREDWSLAVCSDMHRNVCQILRLTGILGELPLQDPPSPS